MGYVAVAWFVISACTIFGVWLFVRLRRRGLCLLHDQCKLCGYVLHSTTDRCTECGCALSDYGIYHKGEVAIATRSLLIVSWLFMMVLPFGCIALVIHPPPVKRSNVLVYVASRFPIQITHFNSDETNRTPPKDTQLPGVDVITIGVPSNATPTTYATAEVTTNATRDCMITIERIDGTLSQLRILPGAASFVLNPGLSNEEMFDRPPTTRDIAKVAGLIDVWRTDPEVEKDLLKLIGFTFVMMKDQVKVIYPIVPPFRGYAYSTMGSSQTSFEKTLWSLKTLILGFLVAVSLLGALVIGTKKSPYERALKMSA